VNCVRFCFWRCLWLFCLCIKYLGEPLNGFVPNLHGRRVWSLARTSLNVKVNAQGHQVQISSPLKMHCNVLAANNVMQQQTGPFHRGCVRFMFVKHLFSSSFFIRMKYLGNRWTDLRQIHTEHVSGPSLGRFEGQDQFRVCSLFRKTSLL